MTVRRQLNLTNAMLRTKGRARAPESEQKGRVHLKYVPRHVVETIMSDLLDHVQHAWERLNDAALSLDTNERRGPQSPVAEPPEAVWHELEDDSPEE